MIKYCRAYQVKELRQFEGFCIDQSQIAPKDTEEQDGSMTESNKELTDEDVLYLQANYNVTDGVFDDEHIVFESDASAWKQFCLEKLNFQVPDYTSA